MAFGISFGTNRTRTDQTTTGSRNETTNQSRTGTNTTSGTTTNNSTSSGSSSTTGSTTSNQVGSQNQTGTSTGTTQQRTNMFDSDTFSGLRGAVQDLLGNIFGDGGTMGAVDSAPMDFFNVNDFINGGVTAARSQIEGGLESDINSIVNATGGATGSNSAAALLASKLRNEAGSNLAGVQSNLTGQAAGIVRDNVMAKQQIENSKGNLLGTIAGLLRGAETTVTGTEAQTTAQSGTTSQSGSTTSAESTVSQQQQQQVQMQTLIEQLNELLAGTTNSTATERVVGTQTRSGGGFGLSL